jgi:hypothetical protein
VFAPILIAALKLILLAGGGYRERARPAAAS